MNNTTSTNQRRVTFTDRAFRRSHNRAPRGRGAWAFQESRTAAAFEGDLVGEVQFFTGTLTEARRAAVDAGMGATTGCVAVLP